MLGLKLKYTSNTQQNIAYLDEGFVDLTTLKIVEVPDLDLGKNDKESMTIIHGADLVRKSFIGFIQTKPNILCGNRSIDN